MKHSKSVGKTGRPSIRSPELAAKICSLIAEGKSLRAICRMKRMPSIRGVFDWLAEDTEFSHQYARAREAQADYYADEIVGLADQAIGQPHEGVAARRLAVDARKWVASKLLPKKYGDRLEAAISGELGVRSMSDDDLKRAIAAVFAEEQSRAEIIGCVREAGYDMEITIRELSAPTSTD